MQKKHYNGREEDGNQVGRTGSGMVGGKGERLKMGLTHKITVYEQTVRNVALSLGEKLPLDVQT